MGNVGRVLSLLCDWSVFAHAPLYLVTRSSKVRAFAKFLTIATCLTPDSVDSCTRLREQLVYSDSFYTAPHFSVRSMSSAVSRSVMINKHSGIYAACMHVRALWLHLVHLP